MNNKTPARSISTINYYEDPFQTRRSLLLLLLVGVRMWSFALFVSPGKYTKNMKSLTESFRPVRS